MNTIIIIIIISSSPLSSFPACPRRRVLSRLQSRDELIGTFVFPQNASKLTPIDNTVHEIDLSPKGRKLTCIDNKTLSSPRMYIHFSLFSKPKRFCIIRLYLPQKKSSILILRFVSLTHQLSRKVVGFWGASLMTTTPRLCRSGSLSNVVVRPRVVARRATRKRTMATRGRATAATWKSGRNGLWITVSDWRKSPLVGSK